MIKLVVLNPQERVEQVKLLHNAERSAMNGVATKVAVEVLVLFEHHDIDALAREEQGENDAGRSSPYNTDCGVKSFIHKQLSGARYCSAGLGNGLNLDRWSNHIKHT